MINADVSNFSIKGPGKAESEDAIIGGLQVAGGVLFAVADGLGGQPAGDVASKTALVGLGLGLGIAGKPDFDAGFRQATRALVEKTRTQPGTRGMATTISAVFIKDTRAHVGHAGDSRIYHIHRGEIEQITKDQTRARQMVDAREMTPTEALHDDRRHLLHSVVSARGKYELEKAHFTVEQGDRILLFTDGVYNLIDEAELLELSDNSVEIEGFSEAICLRINAMGAVDDATAVCVEIE